MNLAGKHILMTGASSGIGLATARALSAEGAIISAVDIKPMEEDVERCTLHIADIARSAEVRKAMAQITSPIDILFHNAGVMRRGRILESTEEEFDLLFNVHVKAFWILLKEALPLLTEHAVIALMSSRHGTNLPVNPALYGLTKCAAMDMADLVQKSYPRFSVKILCPGPVDTALARVGVTEEELQEKRKMMSSAEEIARLTVELFASDGKTRLVFDAERGRHALE